MNLTELKKQSAAELMELALSMNLEGLARNRKQELIFAIVKAHSKQGEDVITTGVLELLPDGFGFLRSPEDSYVAGPDDVYVSPSQIRRFHLRTGDTIKGKIRPPKDSERYFALIKVEAINFEHPDVARERTFFESLTPIYPDERIQQETTQDNLTGRVMDLLTPIGKGQRGLIVSPPRASTSCRMRSVSY